MKIWITLCFLWSFSHSVLAAEDKGVKPRAQAYVEAMLNGEKTNLLRVQDYYGRIYFAKKGTVNSVVKKSDGVYDAEILFETTGYIDQKADGPPITRSEVKKVEKIKRRITFKVMDHALKMIQPLETPFVRTGFEKRYVLEIPSTP